MPSSGLTTYIGVQYYMYTHTHTERDTYRDTHTNKTLLELGAPVMRKIYTCKLLHDFDKFKVHLVLGVMGKLGHDLERSTLPLCLFPLKWIQHR